jgi:Leucine-rich repeat (LRR) protein
MTGSLRIEQSSLFQRRLNPPPQTKDSVAALTVVIEKDIQRETSLFSKRSLQETDAATKQIGQKLQIVRNKLASLSISDPRILNKLQLLSLEYDHLICRVQLAFHQTIAMTQILNSWVRVAPAGEQRHAAANRITEFLNTANASVLDLRDLGLSSLPAIFNLRGEFSTRLQRLELGGNELAGLPEGIDQLQELTSLGLTDNRLIALPSAISQLKKLQILLAGDNQLSVLPETIDQLQELRVLNVSNNKLKVLSAGIGRLQKLQHLSASNNFLNSLPIEICQLPVLTSLILSNNQLSELPAEIGQPPELLFLSLMNNCLTTLPSTMSQLKKLRRLLLDGNKVLQQLPNSLSLPRSCTVCLTGTGLSLAVLDDLIVLRAKK